MNELRRHIYSNTVGRFTIKQLIGRLTPPHLTPCSEGNQEVDVKGGTSEEPTADDSGTGSPTLCPIPARGSVAGQSSLLDEDGSISGAPDSDPLPSNCCHGHRLALNIAECVDALDVREELLESLLCYLELQGWVELLTVTQDTCTLKCYGGRAQLERLAEKVTTVHVALEWCRANGRCLSD